MRQHSEEIPETIVLLDNGCTQFNHSVTANPNGGYDYESVEAAGEYNITNIKFALMLEHYDAEHITECENIIHDNPADNSARIRAYKAVKEWIEEILANEFPQS